jgi:hypothetical protein
MDADAEQQLLVFRHVPVFVPEPALNFDRHLDAADDAAELRQDGIAGIMVTLPPRPSMARVSVASPARTAAWVASSSCPVRRE